MTSVELQDAFYIESKSYGTGKILPSNVVEYYLNKAQDNVFQKYYEKFESGEDKRFALDELITITELSSSTDLSANQDGIKTNGVIWKMPSNFYFSVEESAVDSNSNFIKVKPITRDYYNANIDNPHTKPNYETVWRIDHAHHSDDDSGSTTYKRRELIDDGIMTITDYVITYIKQPATLDISSNVTCDLGYRATKELVIEAVKLAYSSDKDTVGVNMKTSEINNF